MREKMKIRSTKLDLREVQEIAEMTRLPFSEGTIECYPDDLVAIRQSESLLITGENFDPLPSDELSLKLHGDSSHDCQMAALLGENWEEVW